MLMKTVQGNIVGGRKATLKNPTTGEKSKERSRQVSRTTTG